MDILKAIRDQQQSSDKSKTEISEPLTMPVHRRDNMAITTLNNELQNIQQQKKSKSFLRDPEEELDRYVILYNIGRSLVMFLMYMKRVNTTPKRLAIEKEKQFEETCSSYDVLDVMIQRLHELNRELQQREKRLLEELALGSSKIENLENEAACLRNEWK